MPAAFLLIRHCEAQGQEPDAPLTATGHAQALALARALDAESIDWIVSSPYQRALQSIGPLASSRHLEIVQEPRLVERTLSAAPRADWRQQLQRSFTDLDARLPGGESSREAMARVRAVVDELASQGAKCVVLVTHGNLLTLLLRSFHVAHGFDTWEGLQNPDAYRLTVTGGGARIERLPLT